MCLYETMFLNRKYLPNKKNGGHPPSISDERTRYVPIKCGNCIECRKEKAREWQARLQEDIKSNKTCHFVTLTFSNESIKEIVKYIDEKTIIPFAPIEGYELDNKIATVAMRLFNERWRKKNKKALRHWMVTELGHNGTENIHLHGIIWTKQIKKIKAAWKYGFIWDGYDVNGKRINYVNNKTINYSIKYVHKIDKKHPNYKSKILCSPGIGKRYTTEGDWKTNDYKGKETNLTYRTGTGHKIALPKYWKNKLYTDNEKERIWIDALDKQEKWVCGERIDISKNEREYQEALKYHRKRNKQLGYGDDKTGKTVKWENERRIIIINKRINNAKT